MVDRRKGSGKQCLRPPEGSSENVENEGTRPAVSGPLALPTPPVDLIPTFPTTSWEISLFDNPATRAIQSPDPDPTTDGHFIIMNGMTTTAAFFCIARILDLACEQDSGFNILAQPCTLPAPITPTLQQQIIPHKPYIDMLPWPSLRDRMLNSSNAINELEFVVDMASSDLKVWGKMPWDPMGWEVGPQFAKKWWFLMDEGILRTSNFWRAQRGEEELRVVSM